MRNFIKSLNNICFICMVPRPPATEQMIQFDSLTFLMHPPASARANEKLVSLEEERYAILRIIQSSGYDLGGDRIIHDYLMRDGAADLRLYGCFQSLMKMHPLFDLAIAEVRYAH